MCSYDIKFAIMTRSASYYVNDAHTDNDDIADEMMKADDDRSQHSQIVGRISQLG